MEIGYRVKPLTHSEIERAAATVRRDFGLDAFVRMPGWQLFEGIGQLNLPVGRKRIPVSYDIKDDLPNDALACTTYDQDQETVVVTLSAQSYSELEEEDGGNARLSLAHEIGHAKLHIEKLMQLTRIDHRRRMMMKTDINRSEPFRDTEWQANVFAGALLMPGPALQHLFLQGKLNPKEIHIRFGVTYDTALHRIRVFTKHSNHLQHGWNIN